MVVAYEILVSAQGPLFWVLGLRVWGQGLTILILLRLVAKKERTLAG